VNKIKIDMENEKLKVLLGLPEMVRDSLLENRSVALPSKLIQALTLIDELGLELETASEQLKFDKLISKIKVQLPT
jgi:hypothetical protein